MNPTTLTPGEFATLELRLDLYPWQIEALEAFAQWPVSIAAANGSGKTAMLAAPAVAWFFRKHPRGKLVATSGSWNQLKNQLWPSLSRFSRMYGWRVTNGSSPCSISTDEGGVGIGFSTDDENRAEGWHPTFSPEIDPVFLLVDESKGVPDKIFEAFSRCTIKYSMFISSPGAPGGKFFRTHHEENRYYWKRRVTSFECPHISSSKRERDLDIYGISSPIYRSMHLAEFTDEPGSLVLTPEELRQALENQPKEWQRGPCVAFCDFAAGGDENVLAVRHGNRVWIEKAWRQTDTIQAGREFIRLFQANNLYPGEIYGDATGLGIGFCDALKDQGWNIHRVENGASAEDSEHYANRGAEIWFTAAREIRKHSLILPDGDTQFFKQATTRRLEYDGKQRLKLESKDDLFLRLRCSPDRGDAVFGAIACGPKIGGVTWEDVNNNHAMVWNP